MCLILSCSDESRREINVINVQNVGPEPGWRRDVHNGEQQCWSSSVCITVVNVRKVPTGRPGLIPAGRDEQFLINMEHVRT